MSRICLDTSAFSHFQRGHRGAVDHIDRAEWIGVPNVVLGELWTGFLLGTRTGQNARELERFLDHPVVETLPVDAEVSRIYSEIVVELRANGRPLPTNDIWIAATAARAGAAVLTFDAHFREIARVGTHVL